MNKKSINPLTIVSFVLSVFAQALFSCLLSGALAPYLQVAIVVFSISSIISIIFPFISKYNRIKNNQKGKVLEIIAVVLGLFCFLSVWMYFFAWQGTFSDICKLAFLILYIVIYIQVKPLPEQNTNDDEK